MFRARLEHALSLAEAGSRSVGLIFLDAADFKAVNDRWGHATGDEVLAEWRRRISACCSPSDTAARLGGDEFGIIVEQAVSVEGTFARAHPVIAALQAPVTLEHGELFLRCRAGLAVANDATAPTRWRCCARQISPPTPPSGTGRIRSSSSRPPWMLP